MLKLKQLITNQFENISVIVINDSNNHRADAHISSLGRKPLNRLSCEGVDDEKAMEHGHTRAR